MTDAEIILGTAGYMSPEQARGKKVDKRADIWAFGVILFEMLSGERLFEGETVSDTLAAVLKTDPEWERLPKNTPPHVRHLLRRCLIRDPRLRLRDIGEARITLTQPELVIPATAGREARGIPRVGAAAMALATLLAGGALGYLLKPAPPEDTAALPRMLSVDAGPGDEPPIDPCLSPDGRRLAYIRNGSIWVRELDTLAPRHLERTENALDVFWSPRSDRIGYLTSTQILTVDPIDGMPVVVGAIGSVVSSNTGAGGVWSDDGILFARGIDDVFRIPDRGGDPAVYAEADTAREGDLHEPSLLPDGGLLVVPHLNGEAGLSTLEACYGSERIEVARTPGSRIYRPVWSPSGHILFEREVGNPGIWAVPWDLAARRATGEPFLVVQHGSYPSVARDGTLALLLGASAEKLQVVETDGSGKELRRIGDARRYRFELALSPDGQRLALIHVGEGTGDLWIHDLVRGTAGRLTFYRSSKAGPAWSPDGQRIAYYVGNGLATLYTVVQRTDGSGGVDSLAQQGAGASFVPNSDEMIFSIYNDGSEFDLFAGPAVPGGERRTLAADADWQYAGVVSPDGKYVAYVSRETGTDQVFLKRYPDGSGKWQVSIETGQWPRWTARGDRLLYARGNDVVQVAVTTSDPPVLGRPERVFTRPSLGVQLPFGWDPMFAMTPDAERFYFFVPAADRDAPRATMVLYENWDRAFARDAR